MNANAPPKSGTVYTSSAYKVRTIFKVLDLSFPQATYLHRRLGWEGERWNLKKHRQKTGIMKSQEWRHSSTHTGWLTVGVREEQFWIRVQLLFCTAKSVQHTACENSCIMCLVALGELFQRTDAGTHQAGKFWPKMLSKCIMGSKEAGVLFFVFFLRGLKSGYLNLVCFGSWSFFRSRGFAELSCSAASSIPLSVPPISSDIFLLCQLIPLSVLSRPIPSFNSLSLSLSVFFPGPSHLLCVPWRVHEHPWEAQWK